jgi:plasmid stabilization system protein ParE
MKLRFAPRAEKDLGEIHDYIAGYDPAAADRVRQAILDKAQVIARQPSLGMPSSGSKFLRSVLVGRYQYRIHYSLGTEEVSIIHIRHTARRPWPPHEHGDD